MSTPTPTPSSGASSSGASSGSSSSSGASSSTPNGATGSGSSSGAAATAGKACEVCETPARARDDDESRVVSCPNAPKKKRRELETWTPNGGPYPAVRQSEIHYECSSCDDLVVGATSLKQQKWRLCRPCFREVFSQQQFYEDLRDKRARCLSAAEQRRDADRGKGKGKGKRKRGGLAPGRTARRRLSSSAPVRGVLVVV